MPRKLPNIIITGTPGTGKTSHASLLCEPSTSSFPLRHISVGDLIKENGLHTGYNEEWQSYEVDDDKVLDHLEPLMGGPGPAEVDDDEEDAEDEERDEGEGGIVLDWHTCEIFPERWIDLVVVLRCDHTTLWERLEKRNYSLQKIQENNEAEIMQTVLDEARQSYAPEVVVELKSESTDDMEANVERIVQWIKAWRRDRGFPDEWTQE